MEREQRVEIKGTFQNNTVNACVLYFGGIWV